MSKFKEILSDLALKRKNIIYDVKNEKNERLKIKLLELFKTFDNAIYYIMAKDVSKDFADAKNSSLKDFLQASEVMYHFRQKLGDKQATEKYCKEQIWAIKEIGKLRNGHS